jgi:PAS domain S-box-containing protein
MQPIKLRLLVLEDNANDAELEIAELEQAGFDCDWKRVETREHFLAALESPDFDLILSDYALPSFDGLTALSLLLESNVDIPFILVSGTLGEEAAIGSLRAGATDYVLKTRLSRLGPVIKRALHEQSEHRERERTEELLRESEKKYRLLADNTLDTIWTSDLEFNLTYFNEAVYDLLGYTAQELIGVNAAEITPMEMMEPLRAAAEELVKKYENGKIVQQRLEIQQIRKDGITIEVELRANLLLDNDENIIGFQGRTVNITERKQAEAALIESEEKMRTTLKSIGDAVIATDASGRIELMNPIAEKLTGWTLADAAGKLLKDVFPIFNEQTREPVRSPVDLVLKSGKSVELANHTILLSKDGCEIPITDSGAPIKDRSGTISGVVLVFRDQTKERSARNALAKNTARLRRAQQIAQVGDWQIDLATNTVTASTIAKQIYGIDENEWTISDIQNRPIIEHREMLHKALTALVEHGAPYDVEFTIRRASDGELVEIHSVAEYDPENRQIFGVIQDITNRKRAERTLKENQAYLKAIWTAMDIGIILIDAETRQILRVNPAMLNLGNYVEKELIGKVCHTVLCPADEGNCPVGDLGLQVDRSERKLVCSDGSLIDVEKSVTSLTLNGRKVYLETLIDISERKRLSRQLELVQFAVDHMATPAYWAREDGKLFYVNEASCLSLGYSKEEFLQMYVWDMDPKIRKDNWKYFSNTNNPGKSDSRETTHRRKDGSEFPVEVNSSYIEFGVSKLICGFAHDISRRKQAEREIQFEQNLFHSFMETVPAAVFFKDLNGRIISANGNYAKAHKTDPQLLIGKSDFDFFSEETAQRKLRDEQQVMETRESIRIEELDNGIWHMTTKAPRFDENGEVIGTFGISLDITQRKESEEKLKESQLFLRTIIDTVPSSIFWKDRNLVYRGGNLAFAQNAGLKSTNDINGKTDFDFAWSREQSEAFRTDDMEIIESGTAKLNEEIQMQADRTTHWLKTSKLPLLDTQENIIGVLGIFADVTEQKRMENAIKKRIIALTRPLEEVGAVEFEELFEIKEIQRLQDEFSSATGTAATIIRPDGSPITRPSNFIDLCKLIRTTDKGCINCRKSDQTIGAYHPDGSLVQPCLNLGLLDAGANITVGGKHIASWLIGQVRDKTQSEESIRAHARKIGVDETDLLKAYTKVPEMSRKQFEHVAQALFTLANQLSTSAHQNIQQARFIAEQERADRMFKNFFEQPTNLNLISDFEGIIIQTNPGWEVHLGYEPNQLAGRSYFDFLHPDDIASTKEQMKGFLHGEVVINFKNRYRHNDGTFRHLEWSAVPSVEEKLIYAVAIDVTERTVAEAELRRLSTAIEQSMETIVITDINGVILYANPAFETTSGYRVEEVIGHNPRILNSHHQNEAFYSNLWKTISSGTTWEGRIVNKHKNGSFYTEEASISPIKDADGKIVNYVAVKRDISEELIKEEELRQAQKMEAVGQLASGVAHDFNNILQGIQGFSELLQMSLENGSQEYDNASEIRKAALRASTLTRQMLTFSRKQPFQPEEVELNHVVHDAEAFLNILLGETYELVMDLNEIPESIIADQGHLSQVIMNLCVNARDAMPEGGRLTVSTRTIVFEQQNIAGIPNARIGSFACLAITDSGCGMDAETTERIFDPFFTTKDVGSGTGLGLSVVYGIIKQCDGWIHVYSEKGLGTTFRLYFPLVSPQKQNSENEPSSSTYPTDKRILLVEDDPDVCGMIIKILSAAGYRIMATTNAEDGLALFKKEQGRFELLMSDMVLPGMDGSQLADAIREINPNLPVMLFSGYPDYRERWKHLAKTDYFFESKPFTATKLVDSVATIFKH